MDLSKIFTPELMTGLFSMLNETQAKNDLSNRVRVHAERLFDKLVMEKPDAVLSDLAMQAIGSALAFDRAFEDALELFIQPPPEMLRQWLVMESEHPVKQFIWSDIQNTCRVVSFDPPLPDSSAPEDRLVHVGESIVVNYAEPVTRVVVEVEGVFLVSSKALTEKP